MTVILCALKQEIKPFLDALDNKRKIKHTKMKIYNGSISGLEVMAVRCGVGMSRAGAAVKSLLEQFTVSRIIMSGTAGSTDMRLGIGDTVVSDEIMCHESKEIAVAGGIAIVNGISYKTDDTLLGYVKGALKTKPAPHPVYFGKIATGTTFVSDKNREAITQKYHPLCVDMETAAAAAVSSQNNVPFIAIRSITDTKEKSSILDFFKYVSLASRRSFIVAEKLLGELKNSEDL